MHKETKQNVAIKIMEKKDIREQDFTSQVRREIYIMRHLQHKNIVRLHEVLTSETRLYIVMELVKGGELFDRVERGKLPEDEARRYFQQLIDGVDFCHKRGVAHRDLKPENLLVDENGNIKITDFGFSSMKGRDVNAGLLYTQCGTPDYCAPEIIENAGQGYNGAKVDAWSCGIILYALLCGRLPFRQQDTEKLYDLILACNVTYPSHISSEVRDLLQHLLVKNPSQRFDLASVKRHPWFLKHYEGDDAKRIRKRPFYNKSQSEHSRSQSQSPVIPPNDTSQPTSPTEHLSTYPSVNTPTSTSAPNSTTPTNAITTPQQPPTSTESSREPDLLHNQQPQEPILPADIPVRNTKYNGRPMPSVTRYTDYYGIYKPTSPAAELGAHMRAPTPPTHAVITRVEDRPVTPARRQTSEKTAAAFKAAQEASDKHANVANSSASHSVPPISPGYTAHSPAHSGNPVSSSMPPTGQRPVYGSRPPRSSIPYEGGLSSFGFPHHENEDESSTDQESVDDYSEKVPLRLELPSEPLDLLRSARGRSQQLPTARQQRHRSDLGVTALSSGRMGTGSPVDHGPASMSSVQLQRRGFAPAPNLTTLRVPLGSDVPNSPPVVYSPSGYDRYRSTSPGFNARIGLISDLHSPHGNNQPGITGFPSVWYSGGNGYASSKDDGGSSAGGSIQNEIVARHLWNMVNKLRGTEHPAGRKLSDDLRQDFKILHSELNQMTRYEDSSIVLSNFLTMFETMGLSDGPGSSPGFGNQNRSRGTSDMEEEYDDGTTIGSKDEYPSQGETRYGRRSATDMSSDDVRATLGRRGTDMSSEDEPRSWSPVIAETPRHQSDLAKRRHISDLLNRMIKKTGRIPGEQGEKSFLAADDAEQPTSAADLAELQRLMREHHSGRGEDKIAEDLLLLMDSNNNGGNETPFGTKMTKGGQGHGHSSRSGDSFPRFANGNAGGMKSSRPSGPLRSVSGSNVPLPQNYVPGKFQEPNSMPVRGTNGGIVQNGRSEYRVISGEDLGESMEVARGREGMASSMGMHDVAYYGSDRKNGVANKLHKVLQNMKTKNHKLGERHAQFRSTLPPEVIMQLLGRILKEMGAMVTIKKETKRKMKCRLTIQPNWVLIAGIELCAVEEGLTLVAFRRSKQDKGRTDTESFHSFFERVRKRFIEEANVSNGGNRQESGGVGRGRRKRANENSSRNFSGSTGHLGL